MSAARVLYYLRPHAVRSLSNKQKQQSANRWINPAGETTDFLKYIFSHLHYFYESRAFQLALQKFYVILTDTMVHTASRI